ncbi:hypothetical protein [Curtobacterium sp. MCSS17_015]|uniref:hypothetical protein n=1 Tax=Curtobacterium sp. MCSS17_015 TaxID=2175666 RepID=UPI000DA9FB5F|nr:hypothetical protein [Curtobacterium sp. MCSS17_015]WIB25404.1 hypothetical protein DEJ18_10075 [Curtobacterium sp. MCSS17_015]
MTSSSVSHPSDIDAAVLREFGTDTVDVNLTYVDQVRVGGKVQPIEPGTQFKLSTRRDNVMPTRVYADAPERMAHLDDKAPGYLWGGDDPDEPGNPLGFEFVFLGMYEYVNAVVDQRTLEVSVRFRRVAEAVAA